MTFIELLTWYYEWYTESWDRLVFFWGLIAITIIFVIVIKQALNSWLK